MTTAKHHHNAQRLQKYARLDQPWYKSGGMQVNLCGMGANILLPVLYWAIVHLESDQQRMTFFAIWATFMACSKFVAGMKTVFCVLILPTYFSSLLLNWWVMEDELLRQNHDNYWTPSKLLLLCVALGTIKVGIPMSVCLHRYAAHAAFSTHSTMRYLLCVVGCLAHQGGPIWWAATHRAHHKYCDTDNDPHSPLVDGVERAFAFFWIKIRVLKEMVPRHLNDSELLWILDTWSFSVHTLELALSYYFGGLPAMYVAYTSAWMCQVTTLWFNVINHPVPENYNHQALDEKERNNMKEQCVASNYKYNYGLHMPPGYEMAGYYLPFHILNCTNYIFAQMSAEANHQDHHDHARLGQRSRYDFFYWTFVWPLESAGLVWNVQKCGNKLQ